MITTASLAGLADNAVAAAYERAVDRYEDQVERLGSRHAAGATLAGHNLRAVEQEMSRRGLLARV